MLCCYFFTIQHLVNIAIRTNNEHNNNFKNVKQYYFEHHIKLFNFYLYYLNLLEYLTNIVNKIYIFKNYYLIVF